MPLEIMEITMVVTAKDQQGKKYHKYNVLSQLTIRLLHQWAVVLVVVVAVAELAVHAQEEDKYKTSFLLYTI
jgi:hypothetical protein